VYGVPVHAALVPAVKFQKRSFVAGGETPHELDIPWFDWIWHLSWIGRVSSAYSNNYFFEELKFHFLVSVETLDVTLGTSYLVYA
jgi:hypothetical protein